MALTIALALQKAVEAHKEGSFQDAETLYRAILQAQPKHPVANHNLGLLAVSVNKPETALPLFKIALEADPNQGQFWISYIDALIKEKQFDNASNVLEQGKKLGLAGDKIQALEAQLTTFFLAQNSKSSLKKEISTFTQQHKKVSAQIEKKNNLEAQKNNSIQTRSPSKAQVDLLLGHYQQGRNDMAENLAIAITQKHPGHQLSWKVLGVVFRKAEKLQESFVAGQKAVELVPNDAEAHNSLGITLQKLGRLEDAHASYRRAIQIEPGFVETHNNLGLTLLKLGRLEESETSYKIAISIKPDYAEALFNLSLTLLFLDKLNEATKVLRNLITIDPDNLGLKACVNLAILSFLDDDLSSSKFLLSISAKILNNKISTFKNEISYWRYLSLLLDRLKFKSKDRTEELAIQKLYVIGDSHALTSHGLYIETTQNYYMCQSLWIIGCKQWHLGNPSENEFKYKFQKIIQSIPMASNILLSIGEIDCRLEDGILKYIKKNPNKSSGELIASTIINYFNYIAKTLAPFSHKVTIQGVPCPNININFLSEQDVAELIDLIKEFNLFLKRQSLFFQFNFLDLHKITNRGDGFSNAQWHIDTHHISPAGMQEAWRVSCISL